MGGFVNKPFLSSVTQGPIWSFQGHWRSRAIISTRRFSGSMHYLLRPPDRKLKRISHANCYGGASRNREKYARASHSSCTCGNRLGQGCHSSHALSSSLGRV